MSRLEADRAKLDEAVAIFRTHANLHGNASAEALIRWAHEGGTKKPQAGMVRDAWHDFEAGRRYAELPVQRFVVEYHRQGDMFHVARGDPPTQTDADAPAEKLKGGESVPPPETGGAPSEASTADSSPVPACEHKARVNDGTEVVCDDCGEVLEELPKKPEPRPTPPADDQEVLF